MDADRETEEVEHIPWAMLADELERSRRPSVAKIAAGVVVVVVVGVIAVRSMRATAGTVVEVAPEASPATTEVREFDAGLLVTAPPDPVPEVALPPLYSEADLMAFVPSGDERGAAVLAEWFVMDYFTSARESPGNGSDPGGYSWVDWARASEVLAVSPGQFDVVVVFRTLVDEDGTYRPMDVRSVLVPVELDSAGVASIAGLPQPGPSMPGPEVLVEAGVSEAAPDPIRAAALEVAGKWGDAPEVIGAEQGAEDWQVVVEVGDASALRWRLGVPIQD